MRNNSPPIVRSISLSAPFDTDLLRLDSESDTFRKISAQFWNGDEPVGGADWIGGIWPCRCRTLESTSMRAPRRKRNNPKHLAVGAAPPDTVLAAVADRSRYVGSMYHKDIPSFAGQVPRPRPDASICPRHLAWRQADILVWLQNAIRVGNFGSFWEDGFPRYVWHREGAVTFEARLMSTQKGEYKGYPLEADEIVRGLP